MADTEVKKESNGHSVEAVNSSGDHAKEIKEETTPASSQELEAKIVRQVEHYFGDYNLPRDKFLKETIQSDDGWVPMEVMVKFQRLASLSVDPKVKILDKDVGETPKFRKVYVFCWFAYILYSKSYNNP